MLLLLLLPLVAFALQAPTMFLVSGSVTDITGAAVADAMVVVEANAGMVATTRTVTDGTFQIQTTAPPLRLRVSKDGFGDRTLDLGSDTCGVQIQLAPATLSETTRVYPQPGRIAGPISSTNVETEDIARSSSLMVDDQLRTIPGFSLFRRSSSRVANPTTQGVTMRGLAASGASRSVVMANDLPLNDPFGGWCIGIAFHSDPCCRRRIRTRRTARADIDAASVCSIRRLSVCARRWARRAACAASSSLADLPRRARRLASTWVLRGLALHELAVRR